MVKKLRAVRINARHMEKLKKLAMKEGETVSFFIQQAIRQFLEKKAPQSEAYSSQNCPACEYTSPLNRKTQEKFACVSPSCGFSTNADHVAAANQLRKFLSGDKGQALLASGYRASVNSLWSGRSRDSATKQEPIEETAQCV